MNQYLALTITILYWLLFPVYWIVYFIVQALLATVLFFVHPIYSVILFLLQPVIFVGVFISQVAYLPIDIFKRFETLYIYLGVGGLVGLTVGLFLHGLFNFLAGTLGLKPTKPIKGPTAKEHREARRNKREKSEPTSTLQPFPPAEPIVQQPDTRFEPENPEKQDRLRLSALPRLTLQGPSPEGKRSLYDQTMDEDADSDIL
ncbi:hypothetical protein KVT40_008597 [Elsinoe batatas]|uniref:Uncharacterized protein n=1 Tax=Elsinoe batatas TaxID=2601811 RepID=A0A8K0KTH3_9PEZI|nr:hypothetical protein KVT40_008597 [Elsinoe batatas]